MEFDVQVAHSVTEIGEDAWDSLSAGRPFTNYRWYRYCEVVLGDCLPIYILLSQAGKVFARATFWLKRQELLPVSSRIARFFIGTLIRHWPLMMCQVPFASVPGLILPEGASREIALKEIVKAAQYEAQKYHASFLVFNHLEDESLRSSLPVNFKSVTTLDPGMYLSVHWPNFDAYLKDLSPRTRKNYYRNCRDADRLGIKIQSQPYITNLDAAITLIRNVENRYGGMFNPWVKQLLENVAMIDATWITAEQNGRLLGCELVLGDGGSQFVTALGLDYSVQHIYFLLSYTDVRLAIEKRIQVLHWGSGAYETKQHFGFQLENNHCLIYAGQGPVFSAIGSRESLYTI